MSVRGLLAADCGGTKCDMLLVDADTGRELARAQGTRSDLPDVVFQTGVGRSPEMIQLVFERILAVTPELPEQLEVGNIFGSAVLARIPELATRIVKNEFISEMDAALALGGVDEGIMVLAGTGAAVYGRNPAGRIRFLDGLGPLLGDDGSAFSIGLALIRRLARQEELETGSAPGWEELLRRLKIEKRHCPLVSAETAEQRERQQYVVEPGLAGLISYMMASFDRSSIASISLLTEELARGGDAGALEILNRAAGLLANNVLTLLPKLEWRREDELTIVGVGSVLNRGSFVWPRLRELLACELPRATFVCPTRPQVDGQIMAMLRRRNQFDALRHFIKGER